MVQVCVATLGRGVWWLPAVAEAMDPETAGIGKNRTKRHFTAETFQEGLT
jgi:hypothetical protein